MEQEVNPSKNGIVEPGDGLGRGDCIPTPKLSLKSATLKTLIKIVISVTLLVFAVSLRKKISSPKCEK